MKRILCLVSSMNTGGAETFLMKVYRELDKTKYQMDFCVNTSDNFYENEIKQLGGKIFVVPMKSKHPIKSFLTLKKIVRTEKYNYVMRVNEHSLATLDLMAAKLGGANNLIMRSSNASSGNKLSVFLHKVFKFMPNKIPNIKLAPSIKAAEYTFGKGTVENEETKILHNGLDIKMYTFNEAVRHQLRQDMNIDDKFVIGHVGRFSEQKNHKFLINVFYEIHKKNSNAILLLIGKGELETDIKKQVETLGLTDAVRFLGIQSNVNELLNVMDVFLFPSFFEGMPNTVIEAQTNGLPCVISSEITQEVEVTDLVIRKSLGNPQEWADLIISLYNERKNIDRTIYSNKMKQKGYDIKDCVNNFEKWVFKRG
ncbi:glycosyltransferase family 1 protein [Ligilactobacillus ceti]|nr:glycosyltransferase family 1 protein [Ligilactobacillus ceti]